VVEEMGMRCEVVVFAVFKDEDSIFLEQIVRQDQVRDGRQFLQGVGRVGKDKVELLLACLDEAEGIATQGNTDIRVQFAQTLSDEPVMVAILFYADDVGTSS